MHTDGTLYHHRPSHGYDPAPSFCSSGQLWTRSLAAPYRCIASRHVCYIPGWSNELLELDDYGGGPAADYGAWVLLEKAEE